MKKFINFILILFLLNIYNIKALADIDYDALYYQSYSTPPKLMNSIDPYQDEDCIKYAWSPYPLFRTSSTLYYMDKTIPPGYYLLTPRNLKDKDYVFFKENGKVSFIIPVAKKEAVSPYFYEQYLPKPKLTKWQQFWKNRSDQFYKHHKRSMKMPPPPSYIEVSDVGDCFLIKLYLDTDCYWLLFKRVKF